MKKKGQMIKQIIGAAAVLLAVTLLPVKPAVAAGPAVRAIDKIEIKSKTIKSDTKLRKGTETRVYKIKVNSPSMIWCSGYASSGAGTDDLKVNIYNSKNKKLNGNAMVVNLYGDRDGFYQVKSGTYYLKVRNSNPFTFYYGAVAVNESSGTKKSKAKTIKKGQTKVGIIALGEYKRKVDYYKFKLEKPGKIRFQMAAYSSTGGGVTAALVPSRNVKGITGAIKLRAYNGATNAKFKMEGDKDLPKGTYYLKVYRTNKKSTNDAIYAVSWKK